MNEKLGAVRYIAEYKAKGSNKPIKIACNQLNNAFNEIKNYSENNRGKIYMQVLTWNTTDVIKVN